MWALLIVWAVVFFTAGGFTVFVFLHPRDDVERMAQEDRRQVERLRRLAPDRRRWV